MPQAQRNYNMQDEISGWKDWHDAFQSVDELSSPSELHGILTGIVCVTQAPTALEWTQILYTLQIPPLSDSALQLLTDESEDIAAAIHDDELDLMPMLPDDGHQLQERVAALADWCSGVVLGFGLAAGFVRSDENEWIAHLQDVANVEFEQGDDDEEGEESYNELYEFVRLIPVSLATGRKKVPVSETPLLKFSSSAQVDSAELCSEDVTIFNPLRPS